jgi:uncharacterized glyoxalase superfamily protein PhnB
MLEFWAYFGFEPVAEGELHAAQAKALYGHASDLKSVKLAHPGCDTCDTGYVRLQFWSELANEGLGSAKAIDVGGRWMGIYVRDGMRVSEAIHGEKIKGNHDWSLTALVRAAFAWPEPEISLAAPFMGLREFVALGDEFRLAFVERVGFERPGFGTFAENLPFQNTEGTHANIVQPVGGFSTDFYKEVFGLVTMANGEAHDSGEEAPTIEALKLDDGQTFCIERLVHPDSPGGMLQVYSPYSGEKDLRDISRIGARGLGCYSYRVRDIAEFREAAAGAGAQNITEVCDNEFGEKSICFDAPDGVYWTVSEQPE